jgi:putative ABC transport system permease protein
MMLFRAAWRHFLQHPVQFALSFAGVMFGVALAVAVDVTNQTAVSSFEAAADVLGGRARHVVRPSEGRWLDDAVYVSLVRDGVTGIAPVLEHRDEHPALGRLTFFGIDPFADGQVRRFTQFSSGTGSLAGFLSEERRFFAEKSWAESKGWQPGDTVKLGGSFGDWMLMGVVTAGTDLERDVLRGYIIADIHAVQEQFGLQGKLSRLDVLTDAAANRIESVAGQNLLVGKASEWSDSRKKMTEAFRLNLGALSKLGLLVAVLLVFQTASFSVVQRRHVFVRMVVLGLSARELLFLVLAEVAAIGMAASVAGALAGTLAARFMVPLVGGTMSAFFSAPGSLQFSADVVTLLYAIAAGVGASLLGAALPAIQAARTTVRQKEEPLYEPHKQRAGVLISAISGVVLASGGTWFLARSKPGLVAAYALMLCVVAGWLLLLPLLRDAGARLVRRYQSAQPGALLLAARSVFLLPGGVWSAAGAIALALGMFLGVTVMVNSFRFTVETWLTQVLRADVYVSADGFKLAGDRRAIPEIVLETLHSHPGVRGISLIENRDGRIGSRDIGVQLVSPAEGVKPAQRVREALPDWENRYLNGKGVLVSEPLANALSLKSGDSITVFIGNEPVSTTTLAVYFDFASVKGAVTMMRSVIPMEKLPPRPDGATVYLKEGQDAQEIIALGDRFPEVAMTTGSGLLASSLRIFDQTFLITAVLRYLIGGIAVLGVAGALFSRVLSHMRDLGRMEALGFSRGQLASQMLLEALGFGLLGLAGAIPAGIGFARVLVDVINPASFGWSLVWKLEPADIMATVALGVGSVIIAGLLPVFVFLKRPLISKIREES